MSSTEITGLKPAEERGWHHGALDGAELRALDHLPRVAELRGRIERDLDRTLGALFDQRGDLLQAPCGAGCVGASRCPILAVIVACAWAKPLNPAAQPAIVARDASFRCCACCDS
jgi:hypothetical protein